MFNENKRCELTHAELRGFKGFENVSDDEATEICLQLKELSFIFYGIFQREELKQEKTNTLLHSIKPKKHERS